MTRRAVRRGLRVSVLTASAPLAASALLAGCSAVYSEDLQPGQQIDRRLTVRNPFGPPTPGSHKAR